MNALVPFLIAFVVAAGTLPPLIKLLTRRRAEQVISEDVPESHQAKKGTPTLGGIAIVLGTAVASLSYTIISGGSERIAALTVLMVCTSFLGFLDDYLILSRGRSAGQKWSQKLGAQMVVAGAFLGYLWLRKIGYALTLILIPGVNHSIALPPAAWFVCGVIYLALMSNAVNLSDGLDGLAAGLSIIAAGVCAAVGLYIHDPELAVFSLAIAGACLGFLWYNCHPAQIFMGNTSSIALGMALGAVALLTRHAVLLLLPFAVFLAEAFSVMMQVGYYKMTHERIFRKAPLHHHFEMLGWKETRVVTRFWITALLLGVVSLIWLYHG